MIRYRFSMMQLALCLGAFLAGAFPARAGEQNSTAERPAVLGDVSREWDLQAMVGHLPAADFHNRPGDVSVTDYRLKVARTFKLSSQFSMTLGGGYGLKTVDAPADEALPRELHGLFLEAGGRYRINDRSFVSLRLFPGLYGDFRESASDTLRMPVLALGGYRFDNGISLVGGFIYRFGYHSARFIPALGVSYQPNDNWRLDLVAPRPSVTWLTSQQLQLFVAGDFASDEYEIKDTFGANAMKYSDYKVMGGVGYLPVPGVKVTTAVGYAFDRKFVFYGGNRNDFRVDDVPFVKVSLDLGW